MSLQTDIKQEKPFGSSIEKAMVNVIFTSNWLWIEEGKILKPYGMTIQQYNVLRILRGQAGKPVSINAIIDRMLDKMSNASRLVDKLYLKSYVSRKENEIDRRACDVTITKRGLEVLAEIDQIRRSKEKEVYQKTITDSEAEQLSDLLDKLRGSVE